VDVEAFARAALADFNNGNVDAFADRFAEDGEMLPFRSATEGAYRGPEGVRVWMRETAELFDHASAQIDEIESRAGEVMLTGSLHLRGKGSGAPVELPVVWVFRLSGEKIAYGRAHTSREDAMADLASW
jgi:ketosteroid isomerase-like protein